MKESEKTTINRRRFLGSSAVSTALTLGASPLLKASRDVPAGPALKAAGLIGCGGRGTGAAVDLLKSAPNIRITALNDLLRTRSTPPGKSSKIWTRLSQIDNVS